jgi:hypothetical protein
MFGQESQECHALERHFYFLLGGKIWDADLIDQVFALKVSQVPPLFVVSQMRPDSLRHH